MLQTFAKLVQWAAKKGHITARLLKSNGLNAIAGIEVDEDMVSRVREQLPPQPWPTGTHKVIAEKLGCKPKSVTAAITELIRRGVFKPQHDGQVLDIARSAEEAELGPRD